MDVPQIVLSDIIMSSRMLYFVMCIWGGEQIGNFI